MESVCSFALHDTNDPTISEESALEDGGFVYFTLPIDSTFFVFSNAAGTRTISVTTFSEIIHVHVDWLNDEGSMCYTPSFIVLGVYIGTCMYILLCTVCKSHM